MTLIVEDGTALSTAESYTSVADADTYNTNYVSSAAWTALTTAAKEVFLRKFTRYVDGTYLLRFYGYKKTGAQALQWPRISAYDSSGYSLSDTSVPNVLKNAIAEGAIALADGATLDSVISPVDTNVKRTRDKIGPLETEIEYLGHKSNSTTFVKVELLLGEISAPWNKLYRS